MTDKIKALPAIMWYCPYCGCQQYGEDTLRRTTETNDKIRTDNIICDRCAMASDIFMAIGAP